MAIHPRLDQPFAAGIVGSLPRPKPVQDILPTSPGVDSAEAIRSPQLDAAVRYAVALQETAGLDLISDGEWRRYSYTNIIGDITHGFTSYEQTPDRLGYNPGMYVSQRLEVVRPGLAAQEARALLESTDRATKVCMPSPYILAVRLWDPELSRAAYPTRESFMEALIPTLRSEVETLSRSGVSVIQIDEPELSVLVDPKSRSQFEDPYYEMDLAAEMVNNVIDGVTGVRTALHQCRLNT